MGTKGEVTMKCAFLFKNMWSGKDEKIYPVKLLKTLSEFAPHVNITIDES